jgi:hypothetical protein
MIALGSDLVLYSVLAEVTKRAMEGDTKAWVKKLIPGVQDSAYDEYAALLRNKAPKAMLGYAREMGHYPFWAVFLTSETLAQPTLGMETVPGEQGFAVTERVEVWSVSKNAMETRVLNAFARGAIVACEGAILETEFVAGLQYQGTRDLAPQQPYLPEDLWVRAQTWEVVWALSVEAVRFDAQVLLTPPALLGFEVEEVRPGVKGKVKV